MVNKKSKSDVPGLRDKLHLLDSQTAVALTTVQSQINQSHILAAEIGKDIAKLGVEFNGNTSKIIGTLTVELAKIQHEMRRSHDAVMSAVNVLAGNLLNLQQTADTTFGHLVSEASFPTTPIVPAGQPAASEPKYNNAPESQWGTGPKTNGEKPLLPRLTPDLIPPEGEHLIEYIGEMGIAKTGNHTVKMRFNGTEYVYFLNEQRNTIIKERTERGAPVHVKRGVWDKEPVVEFCWR